MQPLIVLVVEDDALVRLEAAAGLRAVGLEVLEAEDSASALETFSQHGNIAVLFTDIQLPGLVDGLALARIVVEIHPDLFVIATSGLIEPRGEQLPDRTAFIAKPYRVETVAQMIMDAAA